MSATMTGFDMTTDPECIALLADIRALNERADALKDRIYKTARPVVVGRLWDVCTSLRHALARAVADIAPRCDLCGEPNEEGGHTHKVCADAENAG